MSGMSGMTPTSLAAAVVSRKVKIIKIGPVFSKEERICYQMIYYTLYLS